MRHSLALIGAALGLCLAGGCKTFQSYDGVVDLRKVSDRKVSIREIYDRIEVVPLDNAPEDASRTPALSGLWVTADRLLFRDGDRAVLSYRQDGHLAETLDPGVPITDFSVFRDRTLDLLSGYEFREYALPALSLLRRTPLDTLVVPTKIARREENVMILPAYKGNNDYLCEYYFDRSYYAASPGKMDSDQTRSIVERLQMFRSGDDLLVLYPHSGQIWRCGLFYGHFFWPDFKLRDRETVEFLFAQVTDDKFYYDLLLNDVRHLLIINREDRQYTLIKNTREGLTLPLGVIRDGINYYCCPASDLPRHILPDLLDPEGAAALATAAHDGRNVVIKYYLK